MKRNPFNQLILLLSYRSRNLSSSILLCILLPLLRSPSAAVLALISRTQIPPRLNNSPDFERLISRLRRLASVTSQKLSAMTPDPTRTVLAVFAVSGLGLLLDIVAVAIPQWTVISFLGLSTNIGLWSTDSAGCQRKISGLSRVSSLVGFLLQLLTSMLFEP